MRQIHVYMFSYNVKCMCSQEMLFEWKERQNKRIPQLEPKTKFHHGFAELQLDKNTVISAILPLLAITYHYSWKRNSSQLSHNHVELSKNSVESRDRHRKTGTHPLDIWTSTC